MHSKQNHVLHGQHDWRGKETQTDKGAGSSYHD